MKVKLEVKELCKELRKATTGSPEWHKIVDVLKDKYRMSAWAIVSLYQNPPVIEVEPENFDLMTD